MPPSVLGALRASQGLFFRGPQAKDRSGGAEIMPRGGRQRVVKPAASWVNAALAGRGAARLARKDFPNPALSLDAGCGGCSSWPSGCGDVINRCGRRMGGGGAGATGVRGRASGQVTQSLGQERARARDLVGPGAAAAFHVRVERLDKLWAGPGRQVEVAVLQRIAELSHNVVPCASSEAR